jgi:copper transport protein
VLGIVVFILVGSLTSSPPAQGSEWLVPAGAVVGSRSLTVDDLLVSFSAVPNKPGDNIFSVRAASSRKPAPAKISRVWIDFTFPGSGASAVKAGAQEIEPGLFQLGGGYLNLPGLWKITVTVIRDGLPDSQVQLDWVVASLIPPKPVVLSNFSWGSTLAMIALVLLIVGASVTLIVWIPK